MQLLLTRERVKEVVKAPNSREYNCNKADKKSSITCPKRLSDLVLGGEYLSKQIINTILHCNLSSFIIESKI